MEHPISRPQPHVDEHRQGSTSELRAAVFGANDGLVSNTALVLGVAASGVGADMVLLAGTSGLVAGALSMAFGEWISVTGEREAMLSELALERDHLNRFPEEERAELTELLVGSGVSRQVAGRMVKEASRDPERHLELHARLELGIDPQGLSSPIRVAVASFVSFGLCAAIPLVPFVMGWTNPGEITVALSSVGLFGVGVGLSGFTSRTWWFSGGRQLMVGWTAGLVTMAVGRLFQI